MRKYRQRQEEILRTFLGKWLRIWWVQVIRRKKRQRRRRRRLKV